MENNQQSNFNNSGGVQPKMMYDAARQHGQGAMQTALPYFKVAAQGGIKKIGESLDNFETYVQQGPEGIRFLSFGGGVFVFIYGILSCFNILEILEQPVDYIIAGTQVVFGFIAMVLEASPSLTSTYASIERLQKLVHDYVKFLTLLWGRGCFYVYIGAHIMYLSTLVSIGTLLGLYMVIMGMFYLAWNWGYDISKPTGIIIDKIRTLVMKLRACVGRSGSPSSSDPGNNYVRVDG